MCRYKPGLPAPPQSGLLQGDGAARQVPLARRARWAKFQMSLSHRRPCGSMCLHGIFWPSPAQWDLGTSFQTRY